MLYLIFFFFFLKGAKFKPPDVHPASPCPQQAGLALVLLFIAGARSSSHTTASSPGVWRVCQRPCRPEGPVTPGLCQVSSTVEAGSPRTHRLRPQACAQGFTSSGLVSVNLLREPGEGSASPRGSKQRLDQFQDESTVTPDLNARSGTAVHGSGHFCLGPAPVGAEEKGLCSCWGAGEVDESWAEQK